MVRNNTVYGNHFGITAERGSSVVENRVYGNLSHGVHGSYQGASILGNQVYSNAGDGIRANWSSDIRNNVVYDNAGWGLTHIDANTSIVENNTFHVNRPDAPGAYRLLGDPGTDRTRLRNNIFDVDAGLAISIDDDSQENFFSNYNYFDLGPAANLGSWQNAIYATRRLWSYATGHDADSRTGAPGFVDPNGTDNLLGFDGTTDHGVDDNFTLLPSSRAIDAGDPISDRFGEVNDTGSRVDAGYTGNSALANAPAKIARFRQLFGDRKTEIGEVIPINFSTGGLAGDVAVAQWNVGNLSDGRVVEAGDFARMPTGQFAGSSNVQTVAFDTSGLTDPAPQEIYQSSLYTFSGQTMSSQFDVVDGNYTLRLHFAWNGLGNNQRRFDILVNGNVEVANFNPGATIAGGNAAMIVELNGLTAAAGDGLLLQLEALAGGAFINGVEVIREVATPQQTVDLQVSPNGGTTWATIASNFALDRFGRGSFDWRVGDGIADSLSNNARLRIVENGTSAVLVLSDAFQIAPAGNVFYVNDNNTVGDSITTAAGNDANHGKTADQPMASLSALLRLYRFEAGDTIYLDSGTYVIADDLDLLPRHSGITIQGAGTELTTLDRQNTGVNRDVFDLVGADDLVIRDMTLTNGFRGVHVASTGSINNVIDNVTFTSHRTAGIELITNASDLTVRNSTFIGFPGGDTADDMDYGIRGAQLDRITVEDSSFTDIDTNAIDLGGDDILVQRNVVDNVGNTGIRVTYYHAAGYNQVLDNIVANSAGDGFYFTSDILVQGNTAYDNNRHGFFSQGTFGVTIAGNRAYRNQNGFYALGSATITGNRAFANTSTGFHVYNTITNIYGNAAYSNPIGIYLNRVYGRARVTDNLIYANTESGIEVYDSNDASGDIGLEIVNNTIYQPAGRNISIESNSEAVDVYNNLLHVGAGIALFVDSSSTYAFEADHNLYFQSVPSQGSNVSYEGATYDDLASWQAQGFGLKSIEGNPLFVDVDGADNILGYDPAGDELPGGIGSDNGTDDNFYTRRTALGIDAGHTWTASDVDYFGSARRDDPSTVNTGGNRYEQVSLGGEFPTGGVAQNWRSSTTAQWAYTLPFAFPYQGTSYTGIRVGAGGVISMGTNYNSAIAVNNNNPAVLQTHDILAVLWDDIRTSGSGDDIFIDEHADHVTIRWNATHDVSGGDVQFAATLWDDGRIDYHYADGAGINEDLTPTIGIGHQLGRLWQTAAADNAPSVGSGDNVRFDIVPGFVDIGAFEFGGDSNDTTAPTITATLPGAIFSGTTLSQSNAPDAIEIEFSEAINRIDAGAAAAYEVRGAGPDNTFGTADDLLYKVLPQYTPGTTTVTLDLPAGNLPEGLYRITVLSNASGNSGIHDTAGNLLDGDANGTAGGNWVRTFEITEQLAPETPTGFDLTAASDTGASDTDNITADASPVFSGASVMGATVELYADGLLVGSVVVTNPDGSFLIQPTSPMLSAGQSQTFNFTLVATNAAGSSAPTAALPVTIDLDAPVLATPFFNFETLPLYFSFTAGEDLFVGLGGAAVTTTNLTTGSDAGTFTVTAAGGDLLITYDGDGTQPNPQMLDNGNYLVSLLAGVATDAAGNTTQAINGDFFVLAGDANRDRQVSLADFQILRNNFGQSPRTFSQADFNYDGVVNLQDFTILRNNFGNSLPGPGSIFGGGDDEDEGNGGSSPAPAL